MTLRIEYFRFNSGKQLDDLTRRRADNPFQLLETCFPDEWSKTHSFRFGFSEQKLEGNSLYLKIQRMTIPTSMLCSTMFDNHGVEVSISWHEDTRGNDVWKMTTAAEARQDFQCVPCITVQYPPSVDAPSSTSLLSNAGIPSPSSLLFPYLNFNIRI